MAEEEKRSNFCRPEAAPDASPLFYLLSLPVMK